MNPLVSVIVPVYNVSPYLRQCMDSIVNQTLKDIEIICVDDGSTDDSLEILREYERRDSRVKVLQQKNKGGGAARNFGMRVATGHYLMFLDSDDYFEKNMLEDMYSLSKSRDIDIGICNYIIYDESNQCISRKAITNASKIEKKQIFNYKEYASTIFETFGIIAWNKIYKCEFIKKHNLKFQEQKRTNDLLFVTSSLIHADKLLFIDNAYIRYKSSMLPYRKKSLANHPYDCCIAINALYDLIVNLDDKHDVYQSFINLAYSLPKLYLDVLGDSNEGKIYYYYLKESFYPCFDSKSYLNHCYPNQKIFGKLIEQYSYDEYISREYLKPRNIMKYSPLISRYVITYAIKLIKIWGVSQAVKIGCGYLNNLR